MENSVKTRIKRIKRAFLSPKKRKRIPIDKVYFKKGMYAELVPDPFNTSL